MTKPITSFAWLGCLKTFCLLLMITWTPNALGQGVSPVVVTGNIPFAKGLSDGNELAVWTLDQIRAHKDDTVNLTDPGATIEEKDSESIEAKLGYASPEKEQKNFTGTLDLTQSKCLGLVSILVDDMATLTIKETPAGGGGGFDEDYYLKGSALWKEESYKEFEVPLVPGKKYDLTLEYKNRTNLTNQYNGKKDIDGVSIYISLLPVEVIIPKLDSGGNQIDGEFVGASELKVAKWEDAFEGTGTNGSVKDDFIGLDKDRFYVRIPGGANLGIEAIKVATEDCPDASYNDDATRIELTADGSDSISDSMILVSDDEDDDYAGSGAGADDQNNDRTHKVQLGGKFVIKSIFINGTEHEINMKIPVPAKKQVDIKFYRFDFAGSATEQSIRDSMKWVKERYAQVGLEINATYNEVGWPNINGTDGPGKMTIYGNFGVDPSLRQVYYDFIDSVPNSGVCVYNVIYAYSSAGVAVTMSQIALEEEIELKYLNKAFVHSYPLPTTGVATAKRATAAHEILHVLAPKLEGDDHDEFFPNILVTPGQNIYGDHRSRKRINSEQEARIYNHIYVEDVE